jgi:integrase
VGLVTIDAQPVLQKGNDACRTSYITNALDRNERMSFIQKQVGHTTTRMIVDHYYRHVPAPDDGNRLEVAWNSTPKTGIELTYLPGSSVPRLMISI